MSRIIISFYFFMVHFLIVNVGAQTIILNRDPKILEMINEISIKNLEYNVKTLISFGTRHSLSTQKDEKIGIGAAAKWIKSKFDEYSKDSNGRLITIIDYFTVEPDGRRIDRKVNLMNVMAILKGTDPQDNRVLIVGAHFDSRAENVMDSLIYAPGANDDLSGVAAVLELARIMSKREFPATIIFVTFSGEEQGLFGSTHLAKRVKENNIPGLSNCNLIAMLNNDMIGNTLSSETHLRDNTFVRVFSENISAGETTEDEKIRKLSGSEYDSKSRQLARYIKEIGERYVDQIQVKLIFRSDRFLRSGDHIPFNRLGYAAVRFCEMNENYDHQHQNVRIENGKQYGDLPEFIDFEYVRKITALNCAVLANLAMAPLAPDNVYIDVKELTNKTKLQWKESLYGKKPYGYFVLMRETYQPFWEKKFFVNDTSIILPYSKDNYFFAVQSVDEEGHESLPIFPFPVR